MKNKVALITYQYDQNTNFEPLINSLNDFISEVYVINFETKENLSLTNNLVKIDCFDFDTQTTLKRIYELSEADFFLNLTTFDRITPAVLSEFKNYTEASRYENCLAFKKNTFFIDEYINYSSLSDLKYPILCHKSIFEKAFLFDNTSELKISKEFIDYKPYKNYDQFNSFLTIEAQIKATKLYKEKSKITLLNILINPFYIFLKELFFNKCIINRFNGLILANLIAFKKFKENLFIWMKYRQLD